MVAAKTALLALDFDGVIADSIHECLAVSWNAMQALKGLEHSILTTESIPGDYQKQFRQIRNYIRTGEDYLIIHSALESGTAIENQEDFDDYAVRFEAERPDLREAFYAARTVLYQNHYAEWLALNPLYPGMKEFLNQWPEPENLLIISTKRDDFIAAILEGHGIEFPAENIFYAGPGLSKRSIIEAWLSGHHRAASDMVFVDDQVDTLIKVQPAGVRCILAGWGYNDEAQQAKARENRIDMADLPGFVQNWL